MRVAVLTYCADLGAFATVARNIALGLTEAGIQVDILYLSGPAAREISGYPSEVRLVRLGRRARLCWPDVARYLRADRPHVLVSLGWILNPSALLAAAVARTRTPVILNEASLLSYKTRVEHRRQLRLRMIGIVARLLYARAAAITGVSTPVIEDLEVKFGVDPRRVPLRVVPNSVDPHTVIANSLRPDSGLVCDESGSTFVTIARHARQKNLPLLLRAFSAYRAEGGRGTLVLIGAGPDTRHLYRLAAELGLGEAVVFRGSLANPFPQLARATAFVLSSEEEGFGLVLVEAMTLGVPVVSTNCPGGPREILQDGRAGLLVPTGDQVELTRGLHRISADPALRRRLSENGRSRSREYSPAAVTKIWIDVFREVGAMADPPSTCAAGTSGHSLGVVGLAKSSQLSRCRSLFERFSNRQYVQRATSRRPLAASRVVGGRRTR